MAEEEVSFLRDQVRRLNGVLAEYQAKYPPISQPKQSPLSEDGTAAPWLTDKSMLSPLMVEYDSNIHSLQEQIAKDQDEVKELKGQLDRLVAENSRLTRELKETVQSQLSSVDIGDSNVAPSTGDEQLMHNLQTQLQMALQEKESAVEMWQASTQEVERLEQELQNHQFSPRLQALESQASQIKGQYSQSVNELHVEISKLQDENRKLKMELKSSNIQVGDLRHTLEELRKQLVSQEQEKAVLAGKEGAKDSRLQQFKDQVEDLEKQLEGARNTVLSLQREKSMIENHAGDLQKKGSQSEQREYDAMLQIRESVQMVEAAVLEKDQALVREQQKAEEIERLQAAISQLLDEAGARTRLEVDNIKKQCNDNISRLMEEIHALEMDGSEKQAQLDRAIREKRAVESELEKIYQEGLNKGSKDNQAYDELNRRACDAERLRDEANVKVDSLQSALKRAEMEKKKDRQQQESEIQSLRDRISSLGQEFELANEDRIKLTEKLDEMKKSLGKLQKERDQAHRKLNKELTCMGRDLDLKEREHEVKLQSLADSQRSAMMEVRQLLNAQQRMSAKWKEECNTITHKFEQKVNQLRSELSREKKRNNELQKLLKESQTKTSEAEQMLAEYSRNLKRMEVRIRDAENRALEVTQQASRQVARSQLQRQLDMNHFESSKHSSVRTVEELALSDLNPQPDNIEQRVTPLTNGALKDAEVLR